MSLPQLTEQNFESALLSTELPVLIKFTAEWCQPCKQVAPEVEALAKELEGKAIVVECDIDKSPNITQQLGIQSVPTFAVFSGGRPVAGKAGVLRKAQLMQLIEPFLPRAAGAIKVAEAVKLIKAGQIVPVDLREEIVYNRVHLPQAVSFPQDVIETRLAELGMLSGVPMLYCRTGKEGKTIAEKLHTLGLQVAYLEGGLLEWEATGNGIERGIPSKPPAT